MWRSADLGVFSGWSPPPARKREIARGSDRSYQRPLDPHRDQGRPHGGTDELVVSNH